MNVLNTEAGIGLIESDRGPAGACGEVGEFLKMLAARRGRRILREFEDEVEHFADILCKVGDVFVERAVINREEPDLIVFERHELGEMRSTGVEVASDPAPPRVHVRIRSVNVERMDEMAGRVTVKQIRALSSAAGVNAKGELRPFL